MEAWTSGKVSAAARKARLQSHPGEADRFVPIRGGYTYIGWESSLAYVRAGGRGYRAGGNQEPHPFDLRPVPYMDRHYNRTATASLEG